jgi:hypothetical protein
MRSGLVQFLVVLLDQGRINGDLGRSKGRRCDKLQVWVSFGLFGGDIPDQLAHKPEERLLKVVVGLCTDVIVLQILLAMKGDCLSSGGEGIPLP